MYFCILRKDFSMHAEMNSVSKDFSTVARISISVNIVYRTFKNRARGHPEKRDFFLMRK